MNKHGQWVIEEDSELIIFLYECKAEAGDGAGFKQSTWTAAAAHMSTKHPGVIYNANQCSGKWERVCPHMYTFTASITNCYITA